MRQQNVVDEAGVQRLADVLQRHLVPERPAAFDCVEGHESAAPRDLGVVAVVVEQTDVADDYSPRIDTLIFQDL